MDTVTGALVAAGIAWLSIWAAIALPRLRRPPDPRLLRAAGGAAIAVLGLQVMGLPLPTWSPLVLLAGGFMIAVIIAPKGYAAAA